MKSKNKVKKKQEKLKKNIHLIFLIALGVIIIISVLILMMLAKNLIYPSNNNLSKEVNLAYYAIDGDTFKTTQGETIRLLCVDTPEKGEEGFEIARNHLSSILVNSDNITIERAEKQDKYKRTLAWVYYTNEQNEIILVNKEIIELNLGRLFEYEETDCSKVKD